MLTRFSVRNYMGFPDTVTWDLSHPRDYTFNAHLVKDGVVKNGIIYGINGSGKTSLGRAVFDIVSLDEAAKVDYSKIIYQGNTDAPIDFEYEFKFDGNCSVVYSYSRNNRGTLLRECLALNGVLVFDKDDKSLTFSDEFSVLNGKKDELVKSSNSVSILKFIFGTLPLSEDHYIVKLFDFIRSMLWLRCSLDERNYIGIDHGLVNIEEYIIKNNHIRDFERFLQEESGQKVDFSPTEQEQKSLICRIGDNVVPFISIISTGTASLELLFYWIKRMKESNVKFVFIDDFDAFYHFELSLNVCRTLFNEDFQVFLSSHNTMLLGNDLLRPDCAFEVRNNRIVALSELTDRGELRQGHNIEKMYRAGAFR